MKWLLQELKNSTLPRRKIHRGAEALFILLFVFLNLLPVACGKKGDPVCPAGDRPAAVTDLTVRRGPDGLVLQWTAPTGASGREIYRIAKSTLTREEGCPGCPRHFNPFHMVERRDSNIFGDTGTAALRDTDVTAGNLYTYRVVHCSSREWCSEPSPPAEILY